MGISLGIVLLDIGRDTTFHTNIDMDSELSFENCAVWESGLPQPEVCYILSSRQYLDEPGLWNNRLVFCSGRIPDEVLSQSSAFLVCFSPQLSTAELLNMVQNSVRHFFEWKVELQRMLCRRETTDALLTHLENSWQVYSCISTDAMHIIGTSAHFSEHNNWLDQRDGVSLSLVNDLVSDEDFHKVSAARGAFSYIGFNQDWSYCYNFISGETYSARLIAGTADHDRHFGLLSLVRSFGESMEDVYEEYLYSRFDSAVQKDFEDVVTRLLKGMPVRDTDIHRVLVNVKWEDRQNFQVILLRLLPWAGGRHVGISYYPTQIQKLFRDGRVIDMKDRFICIRNLPDGADPQREYSEKFPYFLRETLCKAGISNIFHDFRGVSRHYLEAESALLLGERHDNTLWYYQFSNYQIPYILDQATRDLLPEELYHPAVSVLRDYDACNGTSLLETLRVFIRLRQNITHAARQLQIHRTSLLARLERIHALTSVDLDDPSVCLHLLLSFELMKRETPHAAGGSRKKKRL